MANPDVEVLARELVDELCAFVRREPRVYVPNDVMRWCWALRDVLEGQPMPEAERRTLRERGRTL